MRGIPGVGTPNPGPRRPWRGPWLFQPQRETDSGHAQIQPWWGMGATHTHFEVELVHAQGQQLKICILTADFWGLKTAGGTATAYHLLAGVLGGNKDFKASSWNVVCTELPLPFQLTIASRHFLYRHTHSLSQFYSVVNLSTFDRPFRAR